MSAHSQQQATSPSSTNSATVDSLKRYANLLTSMSTELNYQISSKMMELFTSKSNEERNEINSQLVELYQRSSWCDAVATAINTATDAHEIPSDVIEKMKEFLPELRNSHDNRALLSNSPIPSSSSASSTQAAQSSQKPKARFLSEVEPASPNPSPKRLKQTLSKPNALRATSVKLCLIDPPDIKNVRLVDIPGGSTLSYAVQDNTTILDYFFHNEELGDYKKRIYFRTQGSFTASGQTSVICYAEEKVFKVTESHAQACLKRCIGFEGAVTLPHSLAKLEGCIAAYDTVSGTMLIHGRSVCVLYEVRKKQWNPISLPKPLSRSYHSAAFCRKSRAVYVFGGEGDNGLFNDVWSFSFSSKSWKEVEIDCAAPRPRKKAAFTAEPNEKYAILYGGQNGIEHFNDLWQFHFDSQQWSRILLTQFLPLLIEPSITMKNNEYLILGKIDEKRTIGALVEITPTASKAEIRFEQTLRLPSLLNSQAELFDTVIKLKNGTAKAHKFVLKKYQSLYDALVCDDQNNTNLLDLSKHEISSKVFINFLLPYMYESYIFPEDTPDIVFDVIDAAKDLQLHSYQNWLSCTVYHRMKSGPLDVVDMFDIALLSKHAIHHVNMIFVRYIRSMKSKHSFINELEERSITLSPEIMYVVMRAIATTNKDSWPAVALPSEGLQGINHCHDLVLTSKYQQDAKERVHVHKAVLVQYSAFFEKYLFGDFIESLNLVSKPEVELDYSFQAIQMLMQLLYGHKITIENKPEVLSVCAEVIQMSDFLMLNNITEMVLEKVVALLDEETLIALNQLVESPKLEEIILWTFGGDVSQPQHSETRDKPREEVMIIDLVSDEE